MANEEPLSRDGFSVCVTGFPSMTGTGKLNDLQIINRRRVVWKLIPAVFFVFGGLISLRASLDTLTGTHAFVYGLLGLVSVLIGGILMYSSLHRASNRT